jgi:HTH-type transcriptional regulator, cell division transcriptional repressor
MHFKSDQAGSADRRNMTTDLENTEIEAEEADIDENWYGPEMATFGDRVAAAREAAGMSQKQMARRLGVKQSTVRGWEDDLSEPRANKLSMMAGLLNVSIVWLLTGEGDGVAAPVDEAAIAPDINAVLVEIRDLKTQIGAAADRLGRLEKSLRMKLKGE